MATAIQPRNGLGQNVTAETWMTRTGRFPVAGDGTATMDNGPSKAIAPSVIEIRDVSPADRVLHRYRWQVQLPNRFREYTLRLLRVAFPKNWTYKARVEAAGQSRARVLGRVGFHRPFLFAL